MKVSVLTSVHRWNDPRIFERQAQSLDRHGYSVTLLAPGAPNDLSTSVKLSGPPLPKNRLSRMTTTSFRLFRLALKDTDVVHFHDPELLIFMLAVKPFRRKLLWIYDVHEDYAEQISEKSWLPRFLRRPASKVFSRLETFASNFCDLIVTATPQISQRFDPAKVALVQNFPKSETFPSLSQETSEDHFRVVHLGLLNNRRGAATIAQALRMLPVESKIVFEQMGPVESDQFLNDANARIRIHKPAKQSEALKLLASADAAALLFYPGPNHDFSQPNKLFEYLAMGLPIIASEIPHWKNLISACSGNAQYVDPHDPQQVAQALTDLEKNSKRTERLARSSAARTTYGWESEEQSLLDGYMTLKRRL